MRSCFLRRPKWATFPFAKTVTMCGRRPDSSGASALARSHLYAARLTRILGHERCPPEPGCRACPGADVAASFTQWTPTLLPDALFGMHKRAGGETPDEWTRSVREFATPDKSLSPSSVASPVPWKLSEEASAAKSDRAPVQTANQRPCDRRCLIGEHRPF